MRHLLAMTFFFILLGNSWAQECSSCDQAGPLDKLIDALERFIDPTADMVKLEDFTICKINPDRNPFNGGWGHWWFEMGEDESYGWWAGEKFDKDLGPADIGRVVTGVAGELNGQSFYGGTATQDPKHGDRPDGIRLYDVYIPKEKTTAEIISEMREFAQSYKGEWSWPRGPNCHVFINQMILKFGLKLKEREDG